MWYTLGYANTIMYTPAHGGRAGKPGDRPPVLVRLYGTSVPDPPRQCRGPSDHHDCARPALHRSDGAQRAACVPPARAHGAPAALVTSPHDCDDLRRGHLRVPARAVHQSPRTFGKPTSRWTLALAAEVSFAQGLTPRLVSDEAIRVALRRLGVAWKRAKHWITSPDPAYARKKNGATN